MEILKGRRGRSAAAGTLLAATALLLTACQSSGSSAAASSPASSVAAPATASAPSGPTSVSTPVGPASPVPVASASPSVAAAQSAADTFLASGQDINGTALHKPACVASYGCPLSGDSTAFLDKMTWSTWSATEAVGTGTYNIDGCNPNCATGTVYPVATVITLSDPVKVCSASGPRWFWSHASFRFPAGLPKALQGSSGPQNPWTFSSVVTAATQSCSS